MECIEVNFNTFYKYFEFLEEKVKCNFNISLEREDILKVFMICKKVIDLVECKFLIKESEALLNEIYIILRKIHLSLSECLSGNYLDRHKTFKSFKNCCSRNEIFLRSLLDDLKELTGNHKISTEIKESNNIKFIIKVTFGNITNSVENIFLNMVQFKDEVYYVKTNDIFKFFYFFRTKDGVWFWSPPKETDPEDVWIAAPQIKIEKGHWLDHKIPQYIEDYIVWLDIFSPNIPEFYFKKKVKIYNEENDPEGKYEKLSDNIDKIEEKIANNKCLIF
jgi:hypothetical protein